MITSAGTVVNRNKYPCPAVGRHTVPGPDWPPAGPDGLRGVGEQTAVLPGDLGPVAAEVGPLRHQGCLALLQAQILLQHMAGPVEQDVVLAPVQGQGEQVGEQGLVLYVELVSVRWHSSRA